MNNDINVQKATPMFYTISGDRIIENVIALTGVNAITAYTDGKNYSGIQTPVMVSGKLTNDFKLTSDSVSIRYSSEDVEGQVGDGITIAKESAVSVLYTQNCYVVANADGDLYALEVTALTLAPASANFPTIVDGDLLDDGAVSAWINDTADAVKITVTATVGTSCTMTIEGVNYDSGTNNDIAAAGEYTVVVTASGADLTTTTYNFTVVAAQNFGDRISNPTHF